MRILRKARNNNSFVWVGFFPHDTFMVQTWRSGSVFNLNRPQKAMVVKKRKKSEERRAEDKSQTLKSEGEGSTSQSEMWSD
jgi:hypothetical protein